MSQARLHHDRREPADGRPNITRSAKSRDPMLGPQGVARRRASVDAIAVDQNVAFEPLAIPGCLQPNPKSLGPAD